MVLYLPSAYTARNEWLSTHIISSWYITGWLRGTVVERRSLAGKFSLYCVRPAADRWPTQPFILSGSINEQWPGIRCVLLCGAIWWMNATGVTTGLVESNGSLPPGGWLKVTCGLTACTPGSAPGPTLGDKYWRTLPFLHYRRDTERAYSYSWQLLLTIL